MPALQPQIVAIAAQVNACQHGFAVAHCAQLLNFLHDLADGAAATFTTGDARDTKAALPITTVLHFDKSARPAYRAR